MANIGQSNFVIEDRQDVLGISECEIRMQKSLTLNYLSRLGKLSLASIRSR